MSYNGSQRSRDDFTRIAGELTCPASSSTLFGRRQSSRRPPDEATVADFEIRMDHEPLTRCRSLDNRAREVRDAVCGPLAGIADWLVESWPHLFWETQTPFRKAGGTGARNVILRASGPPFKESMPRLLRQNLRKSMPRPSRTGNIDTFSGMLHPTLLSPLSSSFRRFATFFSPLKAYRNNLAPRLSS